MQLPVQLQQPAAAGAVPLPHDSQQRSRAEGEVAPSLPANDPPDSGGKHSSSSGSSLISAQVYTWFEKVLTGQFLHGNWSILAVTLQMCACGIHADVVYFLCQAHLSPVVTTQPC